MDWLVGAAASNGVTVVVAVRSDYYAQAAAYPVSPICSRPTPFSSARCLRMSCGRWSSSPPLQPVSSPERGLAKAVSDDVAGEPGGLPLMSTALLSLWEQRDEAD